ncbi:MAG TPA: hypothetical protein VG754_01110, partial [Verrucomicrobiae bacterium]|nr:hypothetical protein [Verrucomicrobiae bacterium]
TIAPVGTNVLLSWPAYATNYQLEAASTLVPGTNWATLAANLSTNGSTISTQLPATGSKRFFRLARGP